MKTTNFKKSLSLILLIVIIAAISLFAAGCGDNENAGITEVPQITTATKETTVMGIGEKSFDFIVKDYDGEETYFVICTDKETVGEALIELGLISGDEGPYGLYVKTVNGISADYDKDGKYWAFYVDGEYGLTGVELAPIEEGKTYSFRVE